MKYLSSAQTFFVDSSSLRLLTPIHTFQVEANPCPGAAMVVAEPPSGVPVLHTGDAR